MKTATLLAVAVILTSMAFSLAVIAGALRLLFGG